MRNNQSTTNNLMTSFKLDASPIYHFLQFSFIIPIRSSPFIFANTPESAKNRLHRGTVDVNIYNECAASLITFYLFLCFHHAPFSYQWCRHIVPSFWLLPNLFIDMRAKFLCLKKCFFIVIEKNNLQKDRRKQRENS